MEVITVTPEKLALIVESAVAKALAQHSPAGPPPDEIGGVEFAARVTGFKANTIYKMAERGEIPNSKKGNRLFFSRVALTEWMMSGERTY